MAEFTPISTSDILDWSKSAMTSAQRLVAEKTVEEKVKSRPTPTGLLGRVFDLTNRGNYASANVALDLVNGGEFHPLKSVLDGFTGNSRAVYSDVLEELGMQNKYAKAGLGFVLDKALDPMTYIHPFASEIPTVSSLFGAADDALSEDAFKSFSDSGQELFGNFVKTLGEDKAKDAMKNVILNTGNKFLRKQAVMKFGDMVVPGSSALYSKIGDILSPVKKMARGSELGQWFGKAFIPNFRPEGITALDWDKMQAFKKTQAEATRIGQADIFDKMFKYNRELDIDQRKQIANAIQKTDISKDFAKKLTEGDAASILAYKQELGKYLPDDLLDPATDIGSSMSKFFFDEDKLNLAGTFKSGYMPGVYEKMDRVSRSTMYKVFENFDEAKAAGWKPIEDASALYAYRGLKSVQLQETKKFYDKMIGSFGQKLNPNKQLAGYSLVKNKWLQGVMFPKDIADELDGMGTAISDEGIKGFMGLYDKAIGKWKGITTSVFPSFHIRNFTNNMWSGYLAGVSNPEVYTQAAELQSLATALSKGDAETIARLANKTIGNLTYRDIVFQAKKTGVLNSGFYGREILDEALSGQSFAQKTLGNIVDMTDDGIIKKLLSPVKTGRQLGTVIEDNARMGVFINELAKGSNVDDAALAVKKYLFDYNDLTNFEKKVMKRIVPFYTFMRKNTPMQISEMVKQPGKFANIAKLKSEIESISDEEKDPEKYMPDWISNKISIRLPWKTENGFQYISPDFGFQDLARGTSIEQWAGQISPIIKAPFEYVANKDLFRKKQLADPNLPPDLQAWEKASKIAMNNLRIAGYIDKMTDEERGVVKKIVSDIAGIPTYEYNVATGRKYYFEQQRREKKAATKYKESWKQAAKGGIKGIFTRLVK